MADTTSQSERDQERTAPRGAEFVPPPGRLATPEQIGSFWVARDHWTPEEKTNFVKEQETLAQRNPEESKHQRAYHTDHMRTALRNDVAQDMPAEEIADRYKAAGHHVQAAEFEKNYRTHQVGEDPEKTEAFRAGEAEKLLKLEERLQANEHTAKPTHDQEPAQAEKPATEQQAPAKTLQFYGDKPRNYDLLKKEHADAVSKSEDKEQRQEKPERKTLTFHQDKNPGHDHGR